MTQCQDRWKLYLFLLWKTVDFSLFLTIHTSLFNITLLSVYPFCLHSLFGVWENLLSSHFSLFSHTVSILWPLVTFKLFSLHCVGMNRPSKFIFCVVLWNGQSKLLKAAWSLICVAHSFLCLNIVAFIWLSAISSTEASEGGSVYFYWR